MKKAITPVITVGCTLLPSYLTLMTALGWMIRFISVKEFLNNRTTRTTLIPPAVEPAQEPINMNTKISSPNKVGHNK